MTGQAACKIWKSAAEPVLLDFDNQSIEQLQASLRVLTALKIALWGEVARDENGALSIIARDHSTLTANLNWRKSSK